MYQNCRSYSPVNDFLDTHPKYKKKAKLVTLFKCKIHGKIDIKYDKLINISGVKFCPHCLQDFFERQGICQLTKSKEHR